MSDAIYLVHVKCKLGQRKRVKIILPQLDGLPLFSYYQFYTFIKRSYLTVSLLFCGYFCFVIALRNARNYN